MMITSADNSLIPSCSSSTTSSKYLKTTLHSFQVPFSDSLNISPVSFGAGPFSGRYHRENKDPDALDDHKEIAVKAVKKALDLGL